MSKQVHYNKTMNEDEFDVVSTLATLPCITVYDRLYINEKGLIEKDFSYWILGRVGRTIMNNITDRYNRYNVILFYEHLIRNISLLVKKCHTFFENPYIIGNYKIFGILPVDGDKYIKIIQELKINMFKLKDNINILSVMYNTDNCIYERLCVILKQYTIIINDIKHVQIITLSQ
jgi:hypothetical protein